MAAKQAGLTALITGYARAYHATHYAQKVFDDLAADALYTSEERRFFNQNLASMLGRYAEIDPTFVESQPGPDAALAWVMEVMNGPITLSRSRYTEDSLMAALQQGIGQYVILGAGMDTIAFRRPELADQLSIFEVDHPVTQSMKRERIAQAGWDFPSYLHFIPLDFTEQDLGDALMASAYDRQQLTFLSWLGVTYYLPREAVFSTLEAITKIAPSGSQIAFDYVDMAGFRPETAAPRMRIMQAVAGQVGEPMQTGFDSQSLASDLGRVGWQLVDNLSPADIQRRYFQGRADRLRAFEQVWFARAIMR